MVWSFRRKALPIVAVAFMVTLLYLLFFHLYVKEIYITLRVIGVGAVLINNTSIKPNSTLAFRLVKHGHLGVFQPLTLEIKGESSGGWRISEILFNNAPCPNGVIQVLESGVVEVIFDRVVFISYPGEVEPVAGVDLDGDGSYDFIIEVNPWNLRGACGYANMTFSLSRRMLRYDQRLWDLTPRCPEILVLGYPEIYYGNKPWNEHMALDGSVPIPAKLSGLNDFYVTLNFSLNHDPELSVNLAVESWFTRDRFRFDGVFAGEVEMMIWLYWHELNPAGSMVGEVIVPVEVDGEVVNSTFEVWYADMTWHYIALRIKVQ